MSQPLIVTLPPDRDLWGGCTVRVTALDPATGNTVSGVTIENLVMSVTNVGGTSLVGTGPFMLVPGPGA